MLKLKKMNKIKRVTRVRKDLHKIGFDFMLFKFLSLKNKNKKTLILKIIETIEVKNELV
jgi:hypothetical protein